MKYVIANWKVGLLQGPLSCTTPRALVRGVRSVTLLVLWSAEVLPLISRYG